MKKLLLLIPLFLISCGQQGVREMEINQEKLPQELKGLKIYHWTNDVNHECFIPILNNSFHNKNNISVVNKSINEIIIVDEMISKNDSIVIFKINRR